MFITLMCFKCDISRIEIEFPHHFHMWTRFMWDIPLDGNIFPHYFHIFYTCVHYSCVSKIQEWISPLFSLHFHTWIPLMCFTWYIAKWDWIYTSLPHDFHFQMRFMCFTSDIPYNFHIFSHDQLVPVFYVWYTAAFHMSSTLIIFWLDHIESH